MVKDAAKAGERATKRGAEDIAKDAVEDDEPPTKKPRNGSPSSDSGQSGSSGGDQPGGSGGGDHPGGGGGADSDRPEFGPERNPNARPYENHNPDELLLERDKLFGQREDLLFEGLDINRALNSGARVFQRPGMKDAFTAYQRSLTQRYDTVWPKCNMIRDEYNHRGLRMPPFRRG